MSLGSFLLVLIGIAVAVYSPCTSSLHDAAVHQVAPPPALSPLTPSSAMGALTGLISRHKASVNIYENPTLKHQPVYSIEGVKMSRDEVNVTDEEENPSLYKLEQRSVTDEQAKALQEIDRIVQTIRAQETIPARKLAAALQSSAAKVEAMQ